MRVGSKDSFDRSLFAMRSESSNIDKLRQEFLSNSKILSPEDDPLGSGRIIQIDQELTENDIFNSNQEIADTNLTAIDTQLHSAGTILDNINDIFIRLGSDALSDDNIDTLVKDAQSHLEDLLNIANSRDGHDNAYFSGYQLKNTPFEKRDGHYVYNGDDGSRTLRISGNIRQQINLPGSDVFDHIHTGNGVIENLADSNNTGTAVATPGDQSNSALWNSKADPQGYTVIFHKEGSGSNTSYTYDVIGNTSGNSIFTGQAPDPNAPLARPWKEGENIALNKTDPDTANLGINIKMIGTPNNNDKFHIQAAKSDNAFNLIQDALNKIHQQPHTPEGRQTIKDIITQTLHTLKNIHQSITQANARVGLAQQTISQVKDSTEKQALQLKADRAKIHDFDYTAGTAELMHHAMVFDAMQRSFVKFAQNSLFQYL